MQENQRKKSPVEVEQYIGSMPVVIYPAANSVFNHKMFCIENYGQHPEALY
jgi:hypothetical protein